MRKCICRLRLNEVSRQWRRRPKLPPNASCSCISCSPTGCQLRGDVGRRPASGRSSRPGTSPSRASADGSPGSAARSRCWYGCVSNARWENRCRSAFPQCRPHSRRSPPKQQLFRTSAPVAAQVDAVHVDVWIVPALQGPISPVLDVDVGFLVQFADGGRRDLAPHSASVMSSTRRTETPARYISMRASSTLLSRRRYRSMMAVSKDTPLSRGTWSVTSPEVVVRFLS